MVAVDVGVVVLGRAVRRRCVTHLGLTNPARPGAVCVARAERRRRVIADVHHREAAAIAVADVTQTVSVGVALVGVGRQNTVVSDVEPPVTVQVLRAAGAGEAAGFIAGAASQTGGIREAAHSRIAAARAHSGLVEIIDVRAIVGAVLHTVAVHVVGLAGVAQAVGVGVLLAWVGGVHAVVAQVADAVAIGVQLSGVVDQRTVVQGADTVTVQVVEQVFARLAVAITVAVRVEVVDDE